MRLKVLIGDADPLLLAAYRALLTAEGVQVRTVANGPDCLAALRQAPPDVLILDPELLGEAGVGNIRRMREGEVPALPILVLTTHPEVVAEAGVPIHDCALLLKPVSPATLTGVIRALMEPDVPGPLSPGSDQTSGAPGRPPGSGSGASRVDPEGCPPPSTHGLELAAL
jgi:DNA-binding response OmpR family regulator